jgi:hypothetical protein
MIVYIRRNPLSARSSDNEQQECDEDESKSVLINPLCHFEYLV